MTNPPEDGPPYESDIRSNTSSGLGGIFFQLGALLNALGSIPQLVTLLQQVADDLRKLVGAAPAPSGWQGLPAAMSVDTVNGGGVLDYLVNMEQLLTIIRGQLGTGTPGAHLLAIRNTLNALYGTPGTSLDVLASGLTGLQAQLNATNQVLGSVTADPEGSTIKDLLRSQDSQLLNLVDCLCDGGTDPGDGELPPPAIENVCELPNGFLRNSGYVLRESGGGDDVYSIQFAGIGAASGGAITEVPCTAPDAGVNALLANEDVLICLAYNLAPDTVPASGRRVLMGVNPDIDAGSASGFSYSAGEGSAPQAIRDAGFHLLFELVVPTGTPPPPNNFFLQWGPQPV